MEPVETFEHAGITVEIHYDDTGSATSPREYDNLGTMVCWHPDYILGDEQMKDRDGRGAVDNPVDFDESKLRSLEHLRRYLGIVRGAVCILPLALYDHSGITMYVGGNHDYPFDSAGWDTTAVGFIYTTAERCAELGADPKDAERQLRAEVEEYDSYLRGEVYGYVVKNDDGEDVDSCWGFVGDIDYCRAEAKSAAECEAHEVAVNTEPDMERAAYDAAGQVATKVIVEIPPNNEEER